MKLQLGYSLLFYVRRKRRKQIEGVLKQSTWGKYSNLKEGNSRRVEKYCSGSRFISEEFHLLGYCAVQSVESQPAFVRSMSPPSSGSKSSPNKKAA
jgi:hypothetical protein